MGQKGSGSWFQVAFDALQPGHLAAIPSQTLVWRVAPASGLALAIAFVFGPDGHDESGLHGEISPVCLFNA